ncbi:MAG: hypothetical protein QXW98_06780 [Candidatus Caldarchaeum sp.]
MYVVRYFVIMSVISELNDRRRELEQLQRRLAGVSRSGEDYDNVVRQYCEHLYLLCQYIAGLIDSGEYTYEALGVRLRIRKEILRRMVEFYRRVGEGNVELLVDACLSYRGVVRDMEDVIEAYGKATGSRVVFGRFYRRFDDLLEQLREVGVQQGNWEEFVFFVINAIAKLASNIPDDYIGSPDFYRRIMLCSSCGAEPPVDGWELFSRRIAGRKVYVPLCPSCTASKQQPRLTFLLSSYLDYVAFLEQYVLSLRSQVSVLRAAEEFLNSHSLDEESIQ